MTEEGYFREGYFRRRRRRLAHRNPDCTGAWEVSVAPDVHRLDADPEAVASVLLLCRGCGIYYEVTASTPAQQEWDDDSRYRAGIGYGQEDVPDAPQRPPAEHRPRLDVHEGPLAHRVEAVDPIRAKGLVLLPVEWFRYGAQGEVTTWEVFARFSRDPVAVISRGRGPRGGAEWHYRRFGYDPPGKAYKTPRAAARAIAEDMDAEYPA